MKIKSKKQLQVAENIKRYLANIFYENDILNINDCHLTISEVDISPDLKNAKIYISIFGNESNVAKIIKSLNNNNSFFKKSLAQNAYLKNVPNLLFVHDDVIIKSSKIEMILSSNNKNDSSK